MRRVVLAAFALVVTMVGVVSPAGAGAADQAVLVKDGLTIENYWPMVRSGNRLFFNADDGVHGNELWATDGGENTYLVKDIIPGSQSSIPIPAVDLNGTLLFTAIDTVHGRELWRSDGTEAGTTLVKDINPGSGSGALFGFVNLNGAVLFAADDGVHGPELWKTDGTEAGTALVKDITPGPGSGTYGLDMAIVDNTVFFEGSGQVWKTDGTEAGTIQVSNFPAGAAWITDLTKVGHQLFFVADDRVNGFSLYVTDGTPLGTHLVRDPCPGPDSPWLGYATRSSSLGGLTDVNGTLFFTADDCEHGWELWKSDGSLLGTTMVRDIYPGRQGLAVNSSYASPLAVLGNTLLFAADDGVNGRELWRSDGTEAGTNLVKDINPGLASSGSWDGVSVNGTAYFNANDGVHGRELWRSDGTAAGTALVTDLDPGPASSDPQALTKAGGTLFLGAGHGQFNEFTQLWRVGKPIPAS